MKHERDSFAETPIFLGLGALVALLAIGWAVPTWMQMRMVETRTAELPAANPLTERYGRSIPPAPRLQVNPDRDIEQLRAAEAARLSSYGWVDRGAGVAHIPVTRAIDLLVKQQKAPAPEAVR